MGDRSVGKWVVARVGRLGTGLGCREVCQDRN